MRSIAGHGARAAMLRTVATPRRRMCREGVPRAIPIGGRMALRDWIVKNTVGVAGYGDTLGREVVTNGFALGRTLYLGHGTRPTPCDAFVFEDGNHLIAEGFTLYCRDPLNSPPNEDSSPLSVHTRYAGLAFAAFCTFTAASNFMKTNNSSAF